MTLIQAVFAGAAHTRKDWLLFMHADCQLPQGYFESMKTALEDHGGSKRPVWGCFCTLETGLPSMKLVQWGIRMRTWLRSEPYGDQGLFCSSRAFQVFAAHALQSQSVLLQCSGASVHVFVCPYQNVFKPKPPLYLKFMGLQAALECDSRSACLKTVDVHSQNVQGDYMTPLAMFITASSTWYCTYMPRCAPKTEKWCQSLRMDRSGIKAAHGAYLSYQTSSQKLPCS